VLDVQQRAALQLTCQSPAIPEILVQPSRQQRQRIAVRQLRGGAKPLVKCAANNPVVVYQPEGFIRDDLFELVLGCSGAGDVRRTRFWRHVIHPMPAQSMVVDRKFSRRSLDRCARCQQTLDPHALDMIAALTSPGSRAFWSWHLISPSLYLQK